MQALLFPTFLLITYYLLVGESFMRDHRHGQSLRPSADVRHGRCDGGRPRSRRRPSPERDWGLLSQFWALPVNRASALTGRLLAEAARTLAAPR